MHLPTRKSTPYLLILPMVLLLGFVYGYALVKVFDFSFRRIRGITGVWIGLANYSAVLKDPTFQKAVGNNFTLFIIIPALIAVSILFAVFLYEQTAGWRFHRVALFLPYILAIPVIGIVYISDVIPYAVTDGAGNSGVQRLFAGEWQPKDQGVEAQRLLEEWKSQNPDLVQKYLKWMK